MISFKTSVFFLITIALLSSKIVAQGVVEEGTKYLRSSLYLDLIYLESDFGKKVPNILEAMPFPDKYNNHNKSKTNGSNLEVLLNQSISQITVEPDLDILFQNYIDDSNLENKLIETWFNRQRNGTFDMSVVAKRGFYNASQLEADLAENTVKGRTQLADAGENLIKNTFVLLGLVYINGNHKKFAVGSQVRLYKLNWDMEKAQTFYNDYWIPKGKFNFKKRKAFDTMDLFKLDYVGEQSFADVIKVSRQKPIIELPERRFSKTYPRRIKDKEYFTEIVTRHFDKVYANLQKEYPVFRVATPLLSVNPLTAHIGMKEGLSGGEKFEVLEQALNEETGRTTYKKVGVIIVDKDNIWDNRYNAGEKGIENKKGATQFLGKGSFYEGMLIRQID